MANAIGVDFIRDPGFTADGLRMVFFGQTGGSTVTEGIYSATRSSPMAPFDTAVRIYDSGGAALGAPFYTTDCNRLLFTDIGQARTMRLQ
jgi:hypothetical protein